MTIVIAQALSITSLSILCHTCLLLPSCLSFHFAIIEYVQRSTRANCVPVPTFYASYFNIKSVCSMETQIIPSSEPLGLLPLGDFKRSYSSLLNNET